MSKLAATFLLLVLSAPSDLGQGARPVPRGVREAEQAGYEGEKHVPPPTYKRAAPDPVQIRCQADELAGLAKSVSSEIDQATKGVLDKDLDAKLKKIEKLAKHLRSEISRR
jgi:hypothetical protein